MGAALGRQCWFDNDVFKVYPMLNLLLIGPSGIGKSTCINNLTRVLLMTLKPDEGRPAIIGSGTREKIHEDLVVSPKALLIASELANFFNKAKYMEGLIPYVTQLLDYEDEVETRTKGGGITIIRNPSVTVIGGSTIEWLQEQLPDSAGTGGFLARFLIIAEETKSKRVPLPGLALTPKMRVDLQVKRNKAFWEFREIISHAPEGPLPLQSYEVADFFSDWYVNQKTEAGYLAPFVERSREIVLRLSMLIALSKYSHEIELEDVKSAVALYNIATMRLKSVVVPMSADGKLLLAVLKTIGNQEMSYKKLYAAMASTATDRRIDALVDSHLRSGALIRTPEGNLRRNRGVY